MYTTIYNSPCGMKCCMPKCSSKRKDKSSLTPRSYFSFPKDSTRCKSWLEKCNCNSLMSIDPVTLNRKYRLCSLHFEDKMFSNYQKNRLKPDAIPTIFQDLTEEVPIVEQFQFPLNDMVKSDNTQSCSSLNTGLKMAEKVDIEAEKDNDEMVNADTNNITTNSCTIDSTTENTIVNTTSLKTPEMCIAEGCNNPAVQHPEWDNEYCSVSCTYIHCKATFTAWLSNNKTSKAKTIAAPATQVNIAITPNEHETHSTTA